MEGRNELGRFVKGHNLNGFSETWNNHQKVVESYSINKLTLQKIADKFNCSTGVICKILKKDNIKSRETSFYTKGKSKLDSRRDEVINLYNKGFGMSKIAELMGCGIDIISNLLHKNNVQIKTAGFYMLGKEPPNKLNLDKNKIIDMYNHISGIKIAKHFNCDNSVIYDILNKNNIKIKGSTNFLRGKPSPTKGIKRLKESNEKNKLAQEKLWKDPSYRGKQIKAQLKGRFNRPTSFEQKIILLCSKHKLPFIYTGDGRILIGYKNPDFINEENKVIVEVFLDYFKIRDYGSIKNYMKVRGEHFAKFGYKTIFISEKEIKSENWEGLCLNKMQEA